MWQAFGGYGQIYGTQLPAARKVHRVRLYLAAINEYEHKQQQAQQEEIERAKQDAKRK